MSTWDVWVNSTALNTQGTGVSDITGLGGISGRDFYNQNYYAFDGETSNIGGLTPGVVGMTVWFDDYDRNSGVRLDSLEDRQFTAWGNWQWIVSQFIGDYLIRLDIQTPGLSTLTDDQKTRRAFAQLLTMSQPTWNKSRTQGSVTLGFKVPEVYWHPLAGPDLDADGWKTITVPAGVTSWTLGTNVYPMNGAIEDAVFTIQNGANVIKAVTVKALNRDGSGPGYPQMTFTTPRTAGLIPANGRLVIDTKKHTALMTNASSVTENVFKFGDWTGGRPGSMLRIMPPYSLNFTYTPYTAGQSMAAVSATVKYRPSYI